MFFNISNHILINGCRMDKKELKAVAYHASTVHPGTRFYVAAALHGDVIFDDNSYLVMVNEHGDRVAVKYPNADWLIDAKIMKGYNANIPSFINAIRANPLQMENK